MADDDTEIKDPGVAAENEENKEAENAPEKASGDKKGFISNMSSREKFVALFAILFVVLLLLDFLVVRPMTRHLESLSQQVTEKEQVIPKKLLITKHKARITQVNDALGHYLTDPHLTEEEEIAMLLREIESSSQQVGLFISNINPVETITSGNTYKLKVDVEGAGDIISVKNFIMKLERSNAPVRVSAMNLRSQGIDNPELRYRFTIVKLGLNKS